MLFVYRFYISHTQPFRYSFRSCKHKLIGFKNIACTCLSVHPQSSSLLSVFSFGIWRSAGTLRFCSDRFRDALICSILFFISSSSSSPLLRRSCLILSHQFHPLSVNHPKLRYWDPVPGRYFFGNDVPVIFLFISSISTVVNH